MTCIIHEVGRGICKNASGTDNWATVQTIFVKFCTMVGAYIYISDVASPLSWAVPPMARKSEILSLNYGHLTANISKTVDRIVTCQLELNISWTGAF